MTLIFKGILVWRCVLKLRDKDKGEQEDCNFSAYGTNIVEKKSYFLKIIDVKVRYPNLFEFTVCLVDVSINTFVLM